MPIDDRRGFTLLEVVFALSIMAVGLIATAPMFLLASRENAGGGDLGVVGACAVDRLEHLRGTVFYSLNNGGSLVADVAGYFDASDSNVLVRWQIVDAPAAPAGMKLITVRAIAARQVIGRPKEITLLALRGE